MSGVDTASATANAHIDGRPAFVSPRNLLQQVRQPPPPEKQKPKPVSALDREQLDGLRTIRAFLKARTSYDVLPISYRLIVLDTALLVKKSLNILNQNGIVSAPLWDSKSSTFAGLLTTSDYINVIQYYWQNPDALARVDQFRLNSLRGMQPWIAASVHFAEMSRYRESARREADRDDLNTPGQAGVRSMPKDARVARSAYPHCRQRRRDESHYGR